MKHFMVGSTICNLANWLVFHGGNGLALGRGSMGGCCNADCSNCSRRDSVTAVILREVAKAAFT